MTLQSTPPRFQTLPRFVSFWVVTCVFLGSCWDTSGTGSPSDGETVRDSRTSPESDATTQQTDDTAFDRPEDTDRRDTEAADSRRQSEQPWRRNLPCRNDIEVPDRRAPEYFTVPNDAVQYEPKSREYLKQFLEHNDQFRNVRHFGFGPETKSDRSGYSGYESWVNDVTMYLDLLTRRSPPDGAHLEFAILVNYRPVEFEYVRRPQGGDGAEEQTGSTTYLSLSVDDRLQKLEFTIPKEQFGEGRERIGVYTISTMTRVDSTGNEGYGMTHYRRFVLYYGATGWPDVPCREHYQSSSWLPVEKRLNRDIAHVGTMYIFPAQQRESWELGEAVEADPGERLPINLSLMHYGGDGQPGGALVPFMNEKPAHEMWLYKDGVARENAAGPIGYRRQFVVEAPSEPGTYELFVGYWPDAYKPARDFWGERFDMPENPTTAPGFESNVIPIRVK